MLLKPFLIVLFLSNFLFGCYSVSTSPTQDCAKKGDFIGYDIDAGEFQPGSVGNTYQLPIYIKSDSKKEIQMKLPPTEIYNWWAGYCFGDIIGVFHSNITGKTTTFTKHKRVTLLPKGYKDARDGTTLIGYITFYFPDLEKLQSYGEYRAKLRIKLYEDNKPSKTFKRDIYFHVKPLLVVGLEDVSSETGDRVFKGANVDLGDLDIDYPTEVTSDVYLRSNYDCAGVYLRFNTTPDLKHKIVDDTIGMSYYYKRANSYRYRPIRSGSEILLYYWGKSGGDIPVGNLKFVANSAGGKESGQYSAVVSVTVSVQ